MNAEDAAVFFIRNHFYRSGGFYAVFGDKASRNDHRHGRRFYTDVFGTRFLFGYAAAGRFGYGIDDPRNGIVSHSVAVRRSVQNGTNVVDGDFSHAVRRVRKHAFAVYVPDCPYAAHIRAHALVYRDAFGRYVDSGSFAVPAFGLAFAPDGHKDDVRFYGFVFAFFCFIKNGSAVEFFDAAAQTEFGVFKMFAQKRRKLFVHRRNYFVHHFDNRYLAAERSEQACKFNTDNAAADNAQVFGNLCQFQKRGRIQQFFIVLCSGDRRHCGNRTCGNDDGFRFVHFARFGDLYLSRRDKFSRSHNDIDFQSLHKRSDAGTQRFDRFLFPCGHFAHVEPDVIGMNAELRRFLRVQVMLCRIQKRFCGNAADVQTGSAQILFFDEQNLFFPLREPFGGKITARSASDYNYIIHTVPLIWQSKYQCLLRLRTKLLRILPQERRPQPRGLWLN